VMGIEPTYSAWEADVLPLNYTRVEPNSTWLREHHPYQGYSVRARNSLYCQRRCNRVTIPE
jgi:hypothetical protein